MKLIVLVQLLIQGFRCFVDETIIEFPTDSGLRFVAGVNEVEPRLGANGVGKSALWDALVWCLTGTSVRGERASELASWNTKLRPHVQAVFEIDGEPHTVDRLGSPDVLTIDGNSAPQAAVEALVGLSRMRLLQSVVFGQAAPLFMDLPVPRRGELFDEIMQLDLWVELAEFAGKECNALSKQERDLNQEVTYYHGQLDNIAARLERLDQSEKQWQQKHNTQVAEVKRDLNRAKRLLSELTEPTPDEDLRNELQSNKATAARLHDQILKQQFQLELHSKRYTLLVGNQQCPSCGQPISRQYSKRACEEIDNYILGLQSNLNLNKQHSTHVARALEELSQTAAIQANEQALQREQRASLQASIRALQRQLDTMQEANPFTAQIEDMLTEAGEAEGHAQRLENALHEVREELAKTEYWRRGFRQVRLWLVRRILGVLEAETAAAAASLGIGNWRIKFATETETKSGTTIAGITIQATNSQGQGSYRSYSFGEAQRVKLAVTLGLAALIQAMAGVYWNVEVWDEASMHLSDEGVDDLLNCLTRRATDTAKAIWLVDHRTPNFPFAEVWQVTKQATGSSIKRVA